MAAPLPKLSPKSHKWACTQAKIIATTLSPRGGNLSCPRSSLQFCLGISWKSSLYNSCRLVSGHQNLHRKGTSVPKTSFIFMQYWHDSWGILRYCALANETTPNTHVGCSDTTRRYLRGWGGFLGANTRHAGAFSLFPANACLELFARASEFASGSRYGPHETTMRATEKEKV